MACGLPILSIANVGAAEELVENGVNGCSFDATDNGQKTDTMNRIATLELEEITAFGQESVRILRERGSTATFGQGLLQLISKASRGVN